MSTQVTLKRPAERALVKLQRAQQAGSGYLLYLHTEPKRSTNGLSKGTLTLDPLVLVPEWNMANDLGK